MIYICWCRVLHHCHIEILNHFLIRTNCKPLQSMQCMECTESRHKWNNMESGCTIYKNA